MGEELQRQIHHEDWNSSENNEGETSVLDLPPRSELHAQKSTKKKTKRKPSTIWLRFLFFVFILLVCMILSYNYWDDWIKELDPEPVSGEKQPLHEEVTVEQNSSD
ncbi:hypothetical protein LCL89_02895 [Halobacillus yeomjeoni]|uniref:hypothetical protein n=1 Tax=Halobacillus yeomjeoni TaxID=311194 RepID=UPI001CD1A512|nr:hypothetical protein [Halobacillus yeomjeoni]MCA0982990.1 hypothetical protein [Halobacillus yeomjeoni]